MLCDICPRKCGAIRTEHVGKGFCGVGTLPVVARIAPHFGEEPCISGTRGSGAVFFSGCTMRCKYCQNYEISARQKGITLTPEQLARCYRALEDEGVHNINLVTADHFAPAVAESLKIYKPSVPVVYNCSGYESPRILGLLDGLVDIYLVDFKYGSDKPAEKLSSTPNYVNTVRAAVKEMIFQVGEPQFDDEKMMKKGVIIRQLILPAHTKNSIEVLNIISREFGSQVLVSLMCQYTPWGEVRQDPKLGRKLTKREYDKVKRVLYSLGLDGFTQDMSSAAEEYIPDWNLG